jgi:hypothetical protein
MRIAGILLASALVVSPIERATAQIIGACTQDSQCRPAIVNPCIVDKCVNQACYHTPLCPDDGIVCNGTEFCIAAGASGMCGHDGLDCNDSDACTSDFCQEPNGCGHVAVDCADGDVCTIDYCFPPTGCVHNHIDGCCHSSSECPDLPCVVGRLCAPPYCSPGTPRDCEDGDPDTLDTCDPTFGCVHGGTTSTTLPGGGPCTVDADCPASGDPCLPAACAGGTCGTALRQGLDAVSCVCSRTVPAACAEPLPRGIVKRSTRACAAVTRATQTTGRKRSRLVGRAGRLLAQAEKTTLKKTGKLPAGCGDALAAQLADGAARAEAFQNQ